MPSFKSFALMLSLFPTYVAAQEAQGQVAGAHTPTEFHAGQWGLQFGAGGSFGLASIGILKFTSARSAWMLRFDIDANSLSGTRTDAFGTSTDVKEHSVFFATGVGKRFYQAPLYKVRSFLSIGALGRYTDQKQTFSVSKRWDLGILGELGGGYWVTPNLSLGGTASLAAGYSDRHEVTGPNTTAQVVTDESGWFISGINVLLVIGLYF